MSEINKIYEITRQLSSMDNLREDLNEIIAMAAKHFTNKYLSPINLAINSHKEYCSAHPCKEVNLLTAFKPFVSNNNSIDKIIDIINTVSLFTATATDQTVSAANIADSAIHSDGIYELDSNCINTSLQSLNNSTDINYIILLLIGAILVNGAIKHN